MRSNRSWKRKPGGPRCNCGIWLIVALLALYFGSVTVGIIAVGYLFNAVYG